MSPSALGAVTIRLQDTHGAAVHTDNIWVLPDAVPDIVTWRGGHYVRCGHQAGALCYTPATAYHLIDSSAGSHVRSGVRAYTCAEVEE